MTPGKSELLSQALIDRIRTSRYAVGGRLPGLRALAEEFGVHPNTAARVVTQLAQRGLVRTDQGRGTFVVSVPHPDAGGAVEQLYAALCDLASHARRLGLSRRDWTGLTAEAEGVAFGVDGPALWFVECSRRDGEELAASLSALLEQPVRAMLVEDLALHLVSHPPGASFFITTPFHVDEVESLVDRSAPVVNVNVVPTSETLVRFANFAPGTRVTIVASNEQTLARFVRMLTTFTRIEPQAALLVDDPAAPAAVRAADVIIDSHSIHGRVRSWSPAGGVVTIRYQIEPTSLSFLREVLRQREAERLGAVRSIDSPRPSR